MADYRINKIHGVQIEDNRVPQMLKDIEELKESGGGGGPEVTNAIETGGLGWTEEGQDGAITYDGNFTSVEDYTFVIGDLVGGMAVKVSDLTPTLDQLKGQTVVYYDVELQETTTYTVRNIGEMTVQLPGDAGNLTFITGDDTEGQELQFTVIPFEQVLYSESDYPITIEAGTYFYVDADVDDNDNPIEVYGYVQSLTYSGNIIHRIDEKYTKSSSETYYHIVTVYCEYGGYVRDNKTYNLVSDGGEVEFIVHQSNGAADTHPIVWTGLNGTDNSIPVNGWAPASQASDNDYFVYSQSGSDTTYRISNIKHNMLIIVQHNETE